MKPIFRSAMFGFKKEDVAAFIAKQSKQYESRIAELEAELKSEREAFEKDSSSFEELREKMNRFHENSSQLSDRCAKWKGECEQFLQTVSLCEEQLQKIETDCEKMAERLRFAESFREKAEKFDVLAAALSSVVGGEVPKAAEILVDSVDSSPAFEHFDGFRQQKESALRLYNHLNEMIEVLSQMDEAL